MPSSKQVEYEKHRNSANVSSRATSRVQQKATFINLELTQEEKAALTQFCTTFDELDDLWEQMIDDGYKITAKYDDYSSCYAAFAFPADDAPVSGHILTGRGRHPSRALRQLFFKHFVVLEKDWLGAANSPSARSDEDW